MPTILEDKILYEDTCQQLNTNYFKSHSFLEKKKYSYLGYSQQCHTITKIYIFSKITHSPLKYYQRQIIQDCV